MINSARDKTICSYALTLMIINYLQCGVGPNPVLPSLQATYPVSISISAYAMR